MSEVRLIDANALKREFIKDFYNAIGKGKSAFDVIGAMKKAIDNAPTVIVDSCGKCPYYKDRDRDIITEAYNDGYKTAKQELVKDLVKEKSERPQGEWIKWNFKTFGAMGDWEYKCSNCEKVYGGEYNFCPNCGAEMKGGAE